ncbi:MAG: hypothetical protein O8C63_06020, partial [Candidatus Methanoperedens sp.]|nr:hypothetical protein [Candidatus Methanoperedens sp.]
RRAGRKSCAPTISPRAPVQHPRAGCSPRLHVLPPRRKWKHGLAVHLSEKCPVCGHTTSLAGPLWLGRLHDSDFCGELLGEIEKRGFKEALKLIATCRDELDIPMHYDYHKLCKSLGITAMPTDELILALRERGFRASRTHFSGISFKTDAGMEEIKKTVLELAR